MLRMNKKFINGVACGVVSVATVDAVAAHYADCANPCVRRETPVVLPDSEADQRAPAPERFAFTNEATTTSMSATMTWVSFEPDVLKTLSLLAEGKVPKFK